MTYSQGGLIQATDYNTFAQGGSSVNHGVANINTVWGVGSGDKGYGQSSTLSTVAATNTVTATQWSTMIARLNSILTHQSGSGSGVTAPTAGNTITFLSTLSGKITDGFNNRLNFSSNGSDATATGSVNTSWTTNGSALTVTRTATFGSADQARYFFNAGGKLIVNFGGTNNAGNSKGNDWVDLLGNKLDTIIVGAYTNSRGGSGGSVTSSNTALGYWNAGTSNNKILELTSNSGTADYGSNKVEVFIKTNGVQGSNGDVGTQLSVVLTVTDVAADSFDDAINLTINTTWTKRPPETSNLTDVWGTPTYG
jgi:hypothetical protein